jgi:flagellar hook assembly protein FlgD
VHGMTTIRYQLPLNAATAHITITNAKGQLVQTLTLSSRGKGQVQFNSAALAAGIYNYTLWVNNTLADTKRFVVAR